MRPLYGSFPNTDDTIIRPWHPDFPRPPVRGRGGYLERSEGVEVERLIVDNPGGADLSIEKGQGSPVDGVVSLRLAERVRED